MLSAVWSPFEAGFFVRFQCWANPDMSLPPPIHARCRISINSTTDTLSKTFTQSTMLYSNQTHTQFLTCLWKVNLAKKTSLFSRSGRRRNRDVKKCDFFSIPTKTKSRCWKCAFSEFRAWVCQSDMEMGRSTLAPTSRILTLAVWFLQKLFTTISSREDILSSSCV